jgi:hypothetical protein
MQLQRTKVLNASKVVDRAKIINQPCVAKSPGTRDQAFVKNRS